MSGVSDVVVSSVPTFDELQRVELFRNLNPSQLAAVQRVCSRRQLPGGSMVMAIAEPGDFIYGVVEGAVKIVVTGEEGQEIILAMRGVGEVIGEISLLDGQPPSANVVTQGPCVLLCLRRADYWAELSEILPIVYNLAHILTRRLRFASTQIQALSSLDAQARLARQLLAFAQEYGHETKDGAIVISLRLTQSDLAALVGSSRVRVTQMLGYWKRHKYIHIDQSHHITILDQDALRKYCV